MRIDEVFMFVYKDPHDEMIIDRYILEKITGLGTMPILWCRDGLFCVIPKEVIMNAVNSSKIFQLTDNKITPPVVFLTWSQGIPISNQAGRALIGE